MVNAREVFQRAVLVSATAMAVAHNHPSNRLEPSEEDIAVTKRLQEAGEILGVKLLDHVIVGDMAYHSIRTSLRRSVRNVQKNASPNLRRCEQTTQVGGTAIIWRGLSNLSTYFRSKLAADWVTGTIGVVVATPNNPIPWSRVHAYTFQNLAAE